MKEFIKKHWVNLLTIALILAFFTVLVINLNKQPIASKPDGAASDSLKAQLSGISRQLDSAIVKLNQNDKALNAALTKLKRVEWQLALSTKLAQNNLDSLDAKFNREVERKEIEDEFLKGLGL